jgi:hypothetical protein
MEINEDNPKIQKAQVLSDVTLMMVQVLDNMFNDTEEALEDCNFYYKQEEKRAINTIKHGLKLYCGIVKRNINKEHLYDYFNNAQMVCGMIKLMLSKCGYDNDLMFYKLYKIIEKFPTINSHLKQSADDRNFDFIHLNADDKKRIDDDINLMFRNHFIKS